MVFLWGLFLEGQNIGLRDGTISIRGKEVRINSISGGRGKFSGGGRHMGRMQNQNKDQ